MPRNPRLMVDVGRGLGGVGRSPMAWECGSRSPTDALCGRRRIPWASSTARSEANAGRASNSATRRMAGLSLRACKATRGHFFGAQLPRPALGHRVGPEPLRPPHAPHPSRRQSPFHRAGLTRAVVLPPSPRRLRPQAALSTQRSRPLSMPQRSALSLLSTATCQLSAIAAPLWTSMLISSVLHTVLLSVQRCGKGEGI